MSFRAYTWLSSARMAPRHNSSFPVLSGASSRCRQQQRGEDGAHFQVRAPRGGLGRGDPAAAHCGAAPAGAAARAQPLLAARPLGGAALRLASARSGYKNTDQALCFRLGPLLRPPACAIPGMTPSVCTVFARRSSAEKRFWPLLALPCYPSSTPINRDVHMPAAPVRMRWPGQWCHRLARALAAALVMTLLHARSPLLGAQ